MTKVALERENLRLERALKRERAAREALRIQLAEALDQQTATSQILKVITASPTDVQPVLDAVAESAARLCGAADALVMLVDGDTMRRAAHFGVIRSISAARPVTPHTPTGRAIVEQRTIHIEDVLDEMARGDYPEARPLQQASGFRTVLAVPLIRDESAVGVIVIRRLEVRPFTAEQRGLVQTFADQAVIAIESVRFFTERQEKNRAVSEALEQQTATSEILRIIAQTQTDAQPVFDAIVESAARLCHAAIAAVFLTDGRRLFHPANYGASVETLASVRAQYPRSLDMESTPGIAILTRSVVHVPDTEDEAAIELVRWTGRRVGFRSVITVPMLREGEAVGALTVGRPNPGCFSDAEVDLLKTFADQAVIAIENVRLFNELQASNRELTAALDTQTATSEILRAISSSPTDVQPVFDTIVQSGLRLLGGFSATMMLLRNDDYLDLVAYTSTSAEADASLVHAFPLALRSIPAGARAVQERRAQAVEDVESAPDVTEVMRETGRARGWRSNLFVPMVRDGVVLGLISITRRSPGPFGADQIALLETFAAQGVIAIENVRLFTELQQKNRALTEALDQQTATAEVLRAISSSPTDVQPVFNAIAESAARLCGANDLLLLVRESDWLRPIAGVGSVWDSLAADFRVPLVRGSVAARSVIDGTTLHFPDLATLPEAEFSAGRDLQLRFGHRTVLAVPLLREGTALGTIFGLRFEVRPFSDQQIALLNTFADQAVIAIENVRLFTELDHKNRALTEALDQQTATSEILRVISSSPTDVQPVFDTIAASALRLFRGWSITVSRVDGDRLRVEAARGGHPGSEEPVREAIETSPRAAGLFLWDAILHRRVQQIADVETDDVIPQMREGARLRGWRAVLAIPMTHEGRAIGVIAVTRVEPGAFSAREIQLLQTFADQVVIAIENVRLFNELKEKNDALVEALQQQTATADILRVISRSPIDLQPVFDTIVQHAVTLCAAASGGLHQLDHDRITLEAQYGVPADEFAVLRRDVFPRPLSRESATGRAILDRAVVQIRDIREDRDYRMPLLTSMRNYRTVLAVPMLRDGLPVGALALWRPEVQPFTDTEIGLVQTFADQAVIAIENVRLFKELQARTAALTRSVDQLTALGEVGRAVSSTLDLETVLTTIVSRAVELSRLDGGVVFEYDEDGREFVQRAQAETGGGLAAARRATRIRSGEGVVGQTAITQEPVQVPDITVPDAYIGPNRDNLIESGVRAILAVPMVREGELIGCLGVTRNQAGDFPAETIELLRTFATQSALAIQNARLFQEIAKKSQEVEAASQHKSEFLANMSHELRTPLNAVIGFSDVLLEGMFGELNEKQAEYLRDILSSGKHLLSLINDILDLSKIEAGRMELDLSDFDAPQAIADALLLMRERATRHGIALTQAIDERLGRITADERKFKQVLLNLLSNSVKFTPSGGKVEVRARLVDSLVEVAVSDTGEGIAPEDQAAVFEEFPAGREVVQEDRRHWARPCAVPEVCRTAWGDDRRREPRRSRVDVHVHGACAERSAQLTIVALHLLGASGRYATDLTARSGRWKLPRTNGWPAGWAKDAGSTAPPGRRTPSATE